MSSKREFQLSIGFFKETIFAQILLVLVFLVLLWFFNWSFSSPSVDKDLLLSNSASLIIDFGNSQRMFNGEVTNGMTVVDSLVASSRAGDFDFKYLVSATGDTIVEEIDGLMVDDMELHFYLNGQEVPMSDLGRVVLDTGDEVKVVIR